MLDFLERIASGFWSVCYRIAGLIFPFFYRAQMYRGLAKGLRYVLHVLAVLVVLGLLIWFNLSVAWMEWLRAPSVAGVNLGKFWLPILFLLLYTLSWLGWWLWRLLGSEDYESDFPDIDEAWDEAVLALNQAGIDLTEAPLFLILGRPASGEEALFKAARLDLMVAQAPRKADAPLHLYANRDAIYVTCCGASLLGRQATLLAGEDAPQPSSLSLDQPDGAEDPFKTLQPKGRYQREIQQILSRAHEDRRELTAEEKAQIRRLDQEDKAETVQRRPRPLLLKNPAEVERWTSRLKHLCHLIVRERRPYCPINGMLALIPLAATDSEDDASQTGTLFQMDVAAARSVLQVHCPMITMLCDLESIRGFQEFLDRFPSEQRQRRLGQRFPLVPDVEPANLPAKIESGVGWICDSLFPNWVYRLFRLESAEGEEMTAMTRGNIHLYQLMGEMSERRRRLGRVLVRGVVTEGDGPPLFGGCYIAGTGKDADRDQAFVPGVFRRLVENQNFVSWTDKALADEADYNRWATYGYTGLAVCTALVIGLGFYFWSKR